MSLFFKYHTKDAKGVDRDGTIEALDEMGAAKKLQEQDLVVISVEMVGESEEVEEKICPKGGKETKRIYPKTGMFVILIFIVVGLALFFSSFFGIFVIQPIGAIPEGVTIVYIRSGLNIPFVASADGLLDKSGAGVSLLGRGIMLGGLAETIKSKEVFRLPYSEFLYLLSTEGKKYEK